jgi:L-lactate dehydrogenase
MADVLVTGDLLGHTTHGLALLAPYLAEIESGSMAKSGEPSLMSARGAAQTWDGGRLPGTWLTLRALDAASAMASSHGTGTVVIRRSHHIACLAVYPLRAAERGLVAIVQSSDPVVRAVVPHGGAHPDHHAEPDRGRPADVGRPDPDRHLEARSRAWDSSCSRRRPARGCRRVAHRS